MEKKYTLLIYEKEFFLNSILQEQFSYIEKYNVFIFNDDKKLVEMINNRYFDLFIFNLETLNNKSPNFMKIFQEYNKHTNMIAYYDEKNKNKEYKNYNISFLKKPFKFDTLLNYLDNIVNSNFSFKNNTYLMEHIQFIPVKKIICNLSNYHEEHLTEKETYLLDYLNKNRNINIARADLLKKIWGVSEDINTHTLETHMYRLKLKLNKIEPNLSFSLLNQNGLYCMKDNV
jgi:DNA-binding response OmpR family regulator